jgi:catechol 2,3-dioxygenase-like lactoylglutathione lyase family enzyme
VFDHVTIRVSDLGASEAFYSTVLRTLGVQPLHRSDELVEWENDFSIVPADAEHPVTRNLHFRVGHDAPDAFHRTLPAAGYRDSGAPDERPEYHAGYYGAYVLDPDGTVEAVGHTR